MCVTKSKMEAIGCFSKSHVCSSDHRKLVSNLSLLRAHRSRKAEERHQDTLSEINPGSLPLSASLGAHNITRHTALLRHEMQTKVAWQVELSGTEALNLSFSDFRLLALVFASAASSADFHHCPGVLSAAVRLIAAALSPLLCCVLVNVALCSHTIIWTISMCDVPLNSAAANVSHKNPRSALCPSNCKLKISEDTDLPWGIRWSHDPSSSRKVWSWSWGGWRGVLTA